MKKHIANILTALRALIALYLLGFQDFSLKYLGWFTGAAVTDLFDGPIARRTNSVSICGSVLDTVADALLYASVVKIFVQRRMLRRYQVIMIIVGLRGIAVSALIGYLRFRKLFFVHSLIGKALGFSCFLLPYSVPLAFPAVAVTIACLLCCAIAVESILIQSTSSTPQTDAPSLLALRARKKG